MTNITIPYEFIPGTKAKASEVNANFIAVADAISSVSDNADLLIEAVETQIDELTSTLANSDLTNSYLFSNGIMAAPNGVASYSVTTITVKSGLKVLIPDGRNDDATLKSIELELEEALTYSCTDASEDEFYLFLNDDETISNIPTSMFKIIDSTTDLPDLVLSEDHMYFVSNSNYYYSSNNGSSYSTKSCVMIGKYSTSDDNLVTYLEVFNPIEFIKKTDKVEVLNWGVPDFDNGVTISSQYEPPYAGYIVLKCTSNPNGASSIYINGINVSYFTTSNLSIDRTNYAWAAAGDTITFSGVGGSQVCTFYPLKGVM
ncbi:MAG: hypothetical protein R3Y28_03625 [Candidatus Gastranaerophilales bacterium]